MRVWLNTILGTSESLSDPAGALLDYPYLGQDRVAVISSTNTYTAPPTFNTALGLLAVVVDRWVCAGPLRPQGGRRRRCAAKALTNAFTPAHVTRVRVLVSSDGTTLPVTVIDDGVDGADTEGSSGLLGLADWVRAVGGNQTVCSAPGDGTSVHAILRAR